MLDSMETNSNQLELPSTNEGFVYSILISDDNPILSSLIPNFGEMMIESMWFADHIECRDDLVNLLDGMKKKMTLATGRKFIIATKLNPMYDPAFDGNLEEYKDDWDDIMVCKCFIADAERYHEEGILDSTILAVIKGEAKVDLSREQANRLPQ